MLLKLSILALDQWKFIKYCSRAIYIEHSNAHSVSLIWFDGPFSLCSEIISIYYFSYARPTVTVRKITAAWTSACLKHVMNTSVREACAP